MNTVLSCLHEYPTNLYRKEGMGGLTRGGGGGKLFPPHSFVLVILVPSCCLFCVLALKPKSEVLFSMHG